jgi:outer membrane murein-binding lipoprotein Lpp
MMMIKKLMVIGVLFSTLFLTGCSMQQVKEKFDELTSWVMQKDQAQEQ